MLTLVLVLARRQDLFVPKHKLAVHMYVLAKSKQKKGVNSWGDRWAAIFGKMALMGSDFTVPSRYYIFPDPCPP